MFKHKFVIDNNIFRTIGNCKVFSGRDRTIRYGELKRSIVGISEKMLISQLKLLCEKGIVNKKSFPEIPPKVEYTLTNSGKELLPIINQIIEFGISHKF